MLVNDGARVERISFRKPERSAPAQPVPSSASPVA